MLTVFKQIFTWWNQQTFGTRLQIFFSGKLVGKDKNGNKYDFAFGMNWSGVIKDHRVKKYK